MALKTEYLIQIIKQGDGANAAVADFKSVQAAASAANTTIATTSAQSAVSVANGTRQIRGALQLISLTAFPQAAQAGILFSAAMNGVRGAMAVAGTALTGGVAGIALIGTAAVTASYGIALLNEQVHALETASNESAQRRSLSESINKTIREGVLAGQITASGAAMLREQLAQASKNVDALKAVATGLRDDLPKAYERLRSMVKAANIETLSGLAQQLQAIEDVYQARLKQIELEEKKTGANLSEESQLAFRAGQAQRGKAVESLNEQLFLKGISNEQERRATELRFEFLHLEQQIAQIKERELMTEQELSPLVETMNKARENQTRILKEQAFWASEVGQVTNHASQQFASGFSQAFVDFVSGVKSAEDAFKQFASAFLRQVAEMIIQALVLKAIKGVIGGIGFADGGIVASGFAEGGFAPRMMAAGGIAGLSMVSQPTYFRNFNAIVGERGPEIMTVLSRPKMMQVGGIEAAVGRAGNFGELAITRAADLQRGQAGGGGGLHVFVHLERGLKSEIVNEAVGVARVTVVRDMRDDTELSQATRKLVS